MAKVRLHGGPFGGQVHEVAPKDIITFPQYDEQVVQEVYDRNAPTSLPYRIISYRRGRQRDDDGALHYDYMGQ